MQLIDILGYLGAALTALNFLPQVLKAWKTKNVDDLSFWMLVLVISAQIVWLAYGFTLQLVPVIIANSSLLVMALILLILKLVYRKRLRTQKIVISK